MPPHLAVGRDAYVWRDDELSFVKLIALAEEAQKHLGAPDPSKPETMLGAAGTHKEKPNYSNVSIGQLVKDGFVPVNVTKDQLPRHLRFDLDPRV